MQGRRGVRVRLLNSRRALFSEATNSGPGRDNETKQSAWRDPLRDELLCVCGGDDHLVRGVSYWVVGDAVTGDDAVAEVKVRELPRESDSPCVDCLHYHVGGRTLGHCRGMVM